ncbi:mitotic checkpoint regulator, MAD2B-interacting-domain-containing protein [Rhexocercosporidium sp. MPI-PUGE-AT-0058]|nr:mitotic checkpoint regulator, MAD2B-interacting-domain-containing protein [Rhexocercosporidium sp. MPI-PUGE-AT-0058]
MGLVDYSDSDGSDTEQKPAVKVAPTSSKSTFQKVVDRSNPGKIRVSLPQAALKDDNKNDEPAAKRAKTGGGAFSGFNSFLPAPKRAGQTTATLGGSNVAKRGLGAGVNLKTGAAPGFSREPESEREYAEEQNEEPASTNQGSGMSLPVPKTSQDEGQKPADEVKLVGKPLMFRPLSVSRKPTKKKKQVPTPSPLNPTVSTPVTPQPKEVKPAQRPKVSLFSMETPEEKSFTPASTGEYKPMMLEVEEAGEDELDSQGLEPSYEDYTPTSSQHMGLPAAPTPPVSQSLDDIAGDLNLSAAERRQLFGRQKGGRGMQSATKVINFNTDQEYLHNEELRAAGEQVTHNPVRAIAPGKHSLKQLVNAAQSQKEALEESFAKGKSNRAEASSRYGW